jgi:2-polyprenyl-3-methyl-5-hydroxy-6-metoxy-1,4-benzoquinol methylase
MQTAVQPIDMSSAPMLERVYSNLGNAALLNLLEGRYARLLDIGCGAGDNASLIKRMNPKCEIFGITHSSAEAAIAGMHMSQCWVADIENDLPSEVTNLSFDVLLFSHVLEHLRDPADVLARFSSTLVTGGQVLIAVPNVLCWYMRLQFLRGDFRYQSEGVLDDTHLHFYTYETADKYLLSKANDLKLVDKTTTGNVPLWLLRRYIFPAGVSRHIDRFGCRHWPNLFGGQVLLRAVKQ